MATYTRTKESEKYTSVFEDFESITCLTTEKRGSLEKATCQYFTSITGLHQGSKIIFEREEMIMAQHHGLITVGYDKGKSYQVIAKSRSQWSGDYRNGQYDVFTHLLLAEIRQ